MGLTRIPNKPALGSFPCSLNVCMCVVRVPYFLKPEDVLCAMRRLYTVLPVTTAMVMPVTLRTSMMLQRLCVFAVSDIQPRGFLLPVAIGQAPIASMLGSPARKSKTLKWKQDVAIKGQ